MDWLIFYNTKRVHHAFKNKYSPVQFMLSLQEQVNFSEKCNWRWPYTGLNIGFEHDGKGSSFARPVLVFKKFNNETFWAIPLTTKIKTGKYWFPVNLEDGVKRTAVLSQVRLADAKRLYQKIGVLDEEHYQKLIEVFIKLCRQ